MSPSDVFISAHDPDASINIRRCECGIQYLPLKRFIHSVHADFDLHSTPQSSGPDVFWQLLRGFLTNCIKHADWYQKVNTEEIYIKSYCQGPSVLLGGPAALALSLARCLSVSDVVRWRILSRLYQTHLTADLQLAHLWLITQVSPRVLKAVEILQSCQFVARSLVMYHQATICPLCTFLWLKLLSLLLQHILFCGLNFGSSLKICLPSRWNIPNYKFSCVFFEL